MERLSLLDLEPTKRERWLVYRCLLTEGVLIGNEEEIWSVQAAYRALATMRLCIDAIERLIAIGFSVEETNVKSVVMQVDDLGDVPFVLDEMAHFLVIDSGARHYWQTRLRDEKFPHTCDRCGAAAYIGLNQVECKAGCR